MSAERTTHGSPRGHGALRGELATRPEDRARARDGDPCEELARGRPRVARDHERHGTHHARRIGMMKTVKHTFTSIGDHSGELARTIGSGTANLARRVGDGTAGLARRVGPRRALIGLAVAAAAVGGSILVIRYLRARSDERFAADDAGDMTGRANGSRRSRTQRNADLQGSQQG